MEFQLPVCGLRMFYLEWPSSFPSVDLSVNTDIFNGILRFNTSNAHPGYTMKIALMQDSIALSHP